MVEIRSPDDETYEKFPFYAGRNVTEIPVVERGVGRVELHRLRGTQYLLIADDAQGWVRSQLDLEFRWDGALRTMCVRRSGDVGPGEPLR